MIRTMKRTTAKKKQPDKPQYEMSRNEAIIILIILAVFVVLFTSYPL